jgi:hypothetical protein
MHSFRPRAAPIADLPLNTMAALLKVFEPLISHAKAESKFLLSPVLVPDARGPSPISPEERSDLLNWLQHRCGESL